MNFRHAALLLQNTRIKLDAAHALINADPSPFPAQFLLIKIRSEKVFNRVASGKAAFVRILQQAVVLARL
jgi:hypothetical protein